jgi:hypothetical protein
MTTLVTFLSKYFSSLVFCAVVISSAFAQSPAEGGIEYPPIPDFSDPELPASSPEGNARWKSLQSKVDRSKLNQGGEAKKVNLWLRQPDRALAKNIKWTTNPKA